MISETQSLDAENGSARRVIARSKLGDTRAEREAETISAVGSPRTRSRGNRQSA